MDEASIPDITSGGKDTRPMFSVSLCRVSFVGVSIVAIKGTEYQALRTL